MSLITKWFLILSLVIMMILGATVLKHREEVQKNVDIREEKLAKIRLSDGNLPKGIT
ncbi:MAG: hypothetical protein IKX68_10590 [Clostridiales bacterium]|nr:hypothetical protein [Clostridiales bacterium]